MVQGKEARDVFEWKGMGGDGGRTPPRSGHQGFFLSACPAKKGKIGYNFLRSKQRKKWGGVGAKGRKKIPERPCGEVESKKVFDFLLLERQKNTSVWREKRGRRRPKRRSIKKKLEIRHIQSEKESEVLDHMIILGGEKDDGSTSICSEKRQKPSEDKNEWAYWEKQNVRLAVHEGGRNGCTSPRKTGRGVLLLVILMPEAANPFGEVEIRGGKD